MLGIIGSKCDLAAERAEMRRWLRAGGIEPVAKGNEPSDTQRLMIQVQKTGADPDVVMARGRARVLAKRKG